MLVKRCNGTIYLRPQRRARRRCISPDHATCCLEYTSCSERERASGYCCAPALAATAPPASTAAAAAAAAAAACSLRRRAKKDFISWPHCSASTPRRTAMLGWNGCGAVGCAAVGLLPPKLLLLLLLLPGVCSSSLLSSSLLLLWSQLHLAPPLCPGCRGSMAIQLPSAPSSRLRAPYTTVPTRD